MVQSEPSIFLLFAFADIGQERRVCSYFFKTFPLIDDSTLNTVQGISHMAQIYRIRQATKKPSFFIGQGGIFIGVIHTDAVFGGGYIIDDADRAGGGCAHCFVEFFLLILHDFKTDSECGILRMIGVGEAGAELSNFDFRFIGGSDVPREVLKNYFKKLAAGDL